MGQISHSTFFERPPPSLKVHSDPCVGHKYLNQQSCKSEHERAMM